MPSKHTTFPQEQIVPSCFEDILEYPSSMVWAIQEYTRTQVAEAGTVLRLEQVDDPYRYENALRIVNNWRAIHGFPLNTFQMRLRICARKVYPHALVSQRVKRVSSIVAKLRDMDMKLPTMQDIAGCRAVVGTVAQVRKLHSQYYQFDLQTGKGAYRSHIGKKVNDYIQQPKPKTGYRSLHLVYEYQSDKDDTHNGLKIELQLRTRLQHAWSTAVETVQRFTGQQLKAGKGEKEWSDFFKLTSSAFAMMEGTPMVEGITGDARLLREKIAESMKVLNVEDSLKGFSGTIKVYEETRGTGDYYFLLILNPQENSLLLKTYGKDQFKQAMKDNIENEKKQRGIPGADTVLVSVNSIRDLPKAYPNYYLDTTHFIDSIKRYLALGQSN